MNACPVVKLHRLTYQSSFILEGLATIVVALAAYFLIQDFPEMVAFLAPEERSWIAQNLKYRGTRASNRLIEESEKFKWKFVGWALTDWQIYLGIFVSHPRQDTARNRGVPN